MYVCLCLPFLDSRPKYWSLEMEEDPAKRAVLTSPPNYTKQNKGGEPFKTSLVLRVHSSHFSAGKLAIAGTCTSLYAIMLPWPTITTSSESHNSLDCPRSCQSTGLRKWTWHWRTSVVPCLKWPHLCQMTTRTMYRHLSPKYLVPMLNFDLPCHSHSWTSPSPQNWPLYWRVSPGQRSWSQMHYASHSGGHLIRRRSLRNKPHPLLTCGNSLEGH